MQLRVDSSLGLAADYAAEHYANTQIWLDHRLDAFAWADPHFSYAQFAELVRESSGWLYAAGLRAGELVAIVKSNNFDIIGLTFGAARMGAIPAILSSSLDPPTLATLLGQIGPALLVTDLRTLSSLRSVGISPDVFPARIIAIDGAMDGVIPLDELRESRPPDPVPRGQDEPVLMTHTSGTTGTPKLTLHASRGLMAQIQAQIIIARFLRFDRNEPIATCVSFAHLRTVAGVIMVSLSGLPLVALANPDPQSAALILSRLKPSYLEAHPAIFLLWEMLTQHEAKPFAPVRFFVSTFDAVHPRTIRKLLSASERRMPLYIQAYGQSEVGPVAVKVYTRGLSGHLQDLPFNHLSEGNNEWPSSRAMDHHMWSPAAQQEHSNKAIKSLAGDDELWNGRCVGWPIPGLTRIRIVDPQTRRQQRSRRSGLVQVASKSRFLNYYGGEDSPQSGDSEQWWNTGDLGFKTRWGCLHFLGRQKDVGPGVETLLGLEDILLDRLDVVTEVVIVQLPDGSLLPVLSTRDDIPLDKEIWDQVTADLPRLEDPIQCRWDDFPRTATWKVKRYVLVKRLQEREWNLAPPGNPDNLRVSG
jgi:acyl-coenzyme A synthetase/AMP-(fatty) acid ligase